MLYEAISGRFPSIFPKIRIDLELPIDKVGDMGVIQDKQRERRASHESRHDAGNEHADVPLHALCRHVLFLYAKRAFVSTGISAELSDITRYLYDIELVPITSTTLVGTLSDFTASFINNSYAVPSGLSPKNDAILREVQQEGSENPYRNILAVRTADLNSDFAQAILAAYQQQNVAEYLLLKYNYANLPAFDYDADFTVDERIVSFYDEYVSPKEGKQIVKVGAGQLCRGLRLRLLLCEGQGSVCAGRSDGREPGGRALGQQ